MDPVLMPNRKMGRFKIAYNYIFNPAIKAQREIKTLMGMVIIIRAQEHHYEDGTIHYVALSNLFDPIRLGEMIPEYRIEASTDEHDNIKITAERIE